MIDIKAYGKLIHVFRSSRDTDAQARHSVQLLSEPDGADNSRYELSNYKLPKGTNYQHFVNMIGSYVEVKLKQWEQDGRHGFYIADIRDINVVKEPEKDKKAS
jgi:hypothetical protein